jgi:hypothetical protein
MFSALLVEVEREDTPLSFKPQVASLPSPDESSNISASLEESFSNLKEVDTKR